MKDIAAISALLLIVCACAPSRGGSSFNWDAVNYVELACKNGDQYCLGRDDRTLMAMTRGK